MKFVKRNCTWERSADEMHGPTNIGPPDDKAEYFMKVPWLTVK